jgi:hypothetical protein
MNDQQIEVAGKQCLARVLPTRKAIVVTHHFKSSDDRRIAKVTVANRASQRLMRPPPSKSAMLKTRQHGHLPKHSPPSSPTNLGSGGAGVWQQGQLAAHSLSKLRYVRPPRRPHLQQRASEQLVKARAC